MVKRICALSLCVCFIFSLCACSRVNVLEYGNTGITEGMYKYLFASLKQYYIDTYSDIEDNGQFWQETAIGDKTYAEYIDTQINETIRDFVISAELFDSYGNKVDDAALEQIDAIYQDAVSTFGSEKALSQALSTMGLDTEELKEAYTLQYKYERMLYDSGIAQADDEAREKFYKEKYACVKVIYIPTAQGYSTDEDGERIVGDDGYYKMYTLTEKEREAKLTLADGIEARLNSGEADFESLYTDPAVNELDVTYYPNGIYICADSLYETGLVAVADVAFKTQIGELSRTRDESGEYLVYRCELPDKAYDDDTDYVQFATMDELCARYKFTELMEERDAAVVRNTEVLSGYSVVNVTPVKY